MNYRTRILGTGMGLPKGVMKNSDFESFLETSDEWIKTRTGIKTRHIANPELGESTLSLCILAAKQALEKSGVKGSELDLIIVGTVTPESVMPTTANSLQAALGASKAFTFDMQAACSGFVYALSIADLYIRSGKVKKALIVGAETLSTLVNWKDRSTAVLFADGAGATVLERTEDEDHCVIDTELHSDGSFSNILNIPHGYAKVPPHSGRYRHDEHTIHMQGSEVFKIACRNMVEVTHSILEKNNMKKEEIDFCIFHQANLRIIDMCLKSLGMGRDKTWINVDKYGNTSAATLPICLHEAWEAGAVKPGDNILMATFGGGVTWGSALLRL